MAQPPTRGASPTPKVRVAISSKRSVAPSSLTRAAAAALVCAAADLVCAAAAAAPAALVCATAGAASSTMLAAAVPVPGIAERGAVPGGDDSSSSIRAAVSAVLCAVLSTV